MNALDEFERFPPFRDLTPEGRRGLAQGTVIHRCVPGGPILQKGQAVAGAYLVLTGRLRVYTLSRSGAEATLYFIDPGETCVLALNCLFNELLYPAWVQAETDTRVAVIPGPVYRQLFEREPAVRELTVHTLSTLVFRLMEELEQLHSSPHRRRVALFLLNHAGADGVLRMTQQRLAGHLGATREVVARILGELAALGQVRTRRGAIEIVDAAALRRTAGADD